MNKSQVRELLSEEGYAGNSIDMYLNFVFANETDTVNFSRKEFVDDFEEYLCK